MFHTQAKHFNRALSQVELHHAGVNPDISLVIPPKYFCLSNKQKKMSTKFGKAKHCDFTQSLPLDTEMFLCFIIWKADDYSS